MIDLETIAEFTWMWNHIFFLETDQGNFIWSDPDYGGSNTITPTNKNYTEVCGEQFTDYGRSKGRHSIGAYCGPNVQIQVS